ncbi:hypothetical protein M8C21_014102, partial [Ambrosia artemisiifolia]
FILSTKFSDATGGAWFFVFSDEAGKLIGFSANELICILCTRGAMRNVSKQHKAGHIFNMDVVGSGGSSTPLTAVYGSTKCGLRQLQS